VTVVLLTHNCASRITPIVERLLALGPPVIAVDNASEDGTADVLAGHPVRLVRLPRNIGAAGRNVGAELAQTPYVAFCDDDGWYSADGLQRAADVLDRHPRLALVGARILVEPDGHLDQICEEMANSPLPDRHGIPGNVLLGFVAGAAVVRAAAYREAGGYDERFFIAGEEETLAIKLARAGWQLRYLPEVTVHHAPSLANAPYLRAYILRNTLWNCWLHRRLRSAVRYTAFVLADTPKNADWLHGLAMAVRGLPWVLRERVPISAELDDAYRVLEERRFRSRRPVFTRRDPVRELRRQAAGPTRRRSRSRRASAGRAGP
jgi:GT2 family glycosyltransferase